MLYLLHELDLLGALDNLDSNLFVLDLLLSLGCLFGLVSGVAHD